jgi:hypothetical protein
VSGLRASPLAPPLKAPQTPLGGTGGKNPAQPRPQTDFSSGVGCFFVQRTRRNPARGEGGRAGAPATPKNAMGHPCRRDTTILPQNPPSHLTHPPDRRRSTSPLAAPLPDGAPSLQQITAVARRITPDRQHFEVVRRIVGLSRSAGNLDLAQEVFGVLPRPWTSSWTPTTTPCSPL